VDNKELIEVNGLIRNHPVEKLIRKRVNDCNEKK
jgi:hypothetical protein